MIFQLLPRAAKPVDNAEIGLFLLVPLFGHFAAPYRRFIGALGAFPQRKLCGDVPNVGSLLKVGYFRRRKPDRALLLPFWFPEHCDCPYHLAPFRCRYPPRHPFLFHIARSPASCHNDQALAT